MRTLLLSIEDVIEIVPRRTHDDVLMMLYYWSKDQVKCCVDIESMIGGDREILFVLG